MIKLKIQKEAYWLELGSGVKVKVKPCTSAVFYEAKAFMHARMSELSKRFKESKENGLVDEALKDLENMTKREALADQNIALGLALAGIIEWEGVLEAESDEKAPLTPEKIEELFSNFWVISENFRNQYSGIMEHLEAEKNVSTSEPSGILEADEVTVKDVAEKTSSAQSKNANTTKQA